MSISVSKRALSTLASIVLTAVIVGGAVGGAGYMYNTNSDATVAELRSAKDNLNSQLSAVQDDNSKLKSQVSDLNKRVSDLNERVTALQKSAPASFEFIPQPENIKQLTIPVGVKVRFLKFNTVDGVSLNGALWEPQDKKPNFAILLLHGTGGNYTGSTNASSPGLMLRFSTSLSSKGFAVLGINDRQNGPNVNKKNLWDIPKDVGAGVSILKGMGYSNIVLLGISLGGEHAVMYEAMTRDPAVKALILSGPVSNNPWRIKYRYASNDPLYCKSNFPEGVYDRLYNQAKDLMAQGKPDAILPEKMPSFTCATVDVNAIAFLTYYSPEGGVTNQWIGKVPVPILYVRDQADLQSNADDARWMMGNATAPSSQVPSIKLVTMPNSDPPSRTAHTVATKNIQLLLDTVSAWLQEMKMTP